MKIMTDGLRKLIKIWAIMRKQGMKAYEYVYVDFAAHKIKFMDEQALIEADLAIVDYEEHDPLYIEGSKFFSLVNAYNSLEISQNSSVFVTEDGNKFNLPQLNIADAAFPDDEYTDWDVQQIDFTADFSKLMSSSLNYVDPDPNSEYSTLYFISGHAVALDETKMFFAKLPAGFTMQTDFPYQLVKMITIFRLEGPVEFKSRELSNGAMMVEFEHEGIRVRFASSAKYSLPVDPLDPVFRSQFEHENYFIVSKNQLNSSVNFLGEFLKDVSDVICTCKFITMDNDGNPIDEPYLRIDSTYSGEVSYKIPVKEFSDASYFNGKVLALYLNIFKSVISTLSNYDTEDILIRYEEGKPAVYFANADNTKNGVDDDVYVIHTVIGA